MEVLQMLKFHLKKWCLHFTKGWMTSPKAMTKNDPDEDLLVTLLDETIQDNLDKVMQYINEDEAEDKNEEN